MLCLTHSKRFWYRSASLVGYGGLLLIAKYTPDLFIDDEEKNPNGVEQWKRGLTGGTLIVWGCLTNVAWFVYTSRLPSQIVLQKSQLWVKQLAVPSFPRCISLLDILPSSRRLPKDNFLSLAAVLEAKTTNGHKISLWLSENATYNNKSWLLNLVDFAAKKKSMPPLKPDVK